MVKLMAIVLLFALFPTVIIGILWLSSLTCLPFALADCLPGLACHPGAAPARVDAVINVGQLEASKSRAGAGTMISHVFIQSSVRSAEVRASRCRRRSHALRSDGRPAATLSPRFFRVHASEERPNRKARAGVNSPIALSRAYRPGGRL